ncbi:hypothetical protein ATSB10_26550 [Dyella thiooxydans]|uniref:Uncharacterized protein n=1 Tax=Dyella thiooxydans TaxID=445710 RepID=A0A161J7S3_9GAMM|nr:hypothetical protein ATSB10_26550 [Dyella thiooxydans]
MADAMEMLRKTSDFLTVIPAKAGIQRLSRCTAEALDSGFRRNDG